MSSKKNSNKKTRRTIKDKIQAARIKELPMPSELMEQLFDETTKIGYETEEEAEYRTKKNEYNSDIFRKIKKIILKRESRHSDSPRGMLDFTEHQKKVFELMYIKDLTLSQVSAILGITSSNVRKTRQRIFGKIKKLVQYDFKIED